MKNKKIFPLLGIKIESSSDFHKIFINDIMHMCIPNSKNTIIQTWIESEIKFCICIKINKQKENFEYNDRDLWETIIHLLNCNMQ